MAINRNIVRIALLVLLAVSILLIIGLSIIFINQYLSTQNSKYQEGANFLSFVADDLGRTPQNQLSLRHLKSVPLSLYSFDYVEIVFTTDKAGTQIASKLDGLESTFNQHGILLQSRYPRHRDTYRIVLLQNTNLPLTLDNLSFKPRASIHAEDWPFITTWNYQSSKSLAVMEIDLMEPNSKGDMWKYQNKAINSNILVLTLDLPYF